MPTDDQQVFVVGQADAPAGFLIPGNGQIKPKVMRAIYDGTNASGDFLPVLQVISDAGIIVGEYVAPVVVAGASARPSWFPQVAESAGVTAATLAQSQIFQRTQFTQAIPSGVVTAITFGTFDSEPGYNPGTFDGPLVVQNPLTFYDFGSVLFTLIVDFEAANYDRYAEMTIANPQDSNAAVSPRIRESVSPDGDRLTLSAYILGGPGPPATTVTANVFQTSGVNRNVTAQWNAKAINGHIFLS